MKIEIIPLNGVIINVPFTKFLGVRFDERYGDTFVYLREYKEKKILHEFHPGPASITKHKNVSARKLRSIKSQIAEYDKDMEECDDDGMNLTKITKKSLRKTPIKSELPMFS